MEQPQATSESRYSYSKRLIETECALICSDAIAGETTEQLHRELRSWFPFEITHQQAREFLNSCIRADRVADTSLIDISYWQRSKKATNIAGEIAEIYRNYWLRRCATNRIHKVTVTPVFTMSSPLDRVKWNETRWANQLTSTLLGILIFVGGAICVALLARKPRQLFFLPAAAIAYLLMLGLSFVFSTSTESYEAACLVRTWPFDLVVTSNRSPASAMAPFTLLDREVQFATATNTISRTIQQLDERVVPRRSLLRAWQKLAQDEKPLWLKRHLLVYAVPNTTLVRFGATAEKAEDAALVANAAAEAYCAIRPQCCVDGRSGSRMSDPEIIQAAAVPPCPAHYPNPIAYGLIAGLEFLWPFCVGAAVGCGGFLYEKLRRAKRTHSATRR